MVDNEGREKENLCHGKGGTKGREISVERDSDQEEGKGKEGGQVGNRRGGKFIWAGTMRERNISEDRSIER